LIAPGYPSVVVLAVFALLVLLFVVLPLLGAALWFVLWTAIGGLVIGALGRLIVPGTQPIGLLATICCGWLGSLLGAGIGGAAGLPRIGTILVSIGVSAVAVAVWSGSHRQLAGRRSRSITRMP
jgi:uncharacterized membrane protein YeaQ/YmgE (transglycosylase-associated protein family)